MDIRSMNVVVTRYLPTFWQRVKIKLFGLKYLSECKTEELTIEDLKLEDWFNKGEQ